MKETLTKIRFTENPFLPVLSYIGASALSQIAITFFSSPFAAAMFCGRDYSFAASELCVAVPPRNDGNNV